MSTCFPSFNIAFVFFCVCFPGFVWNYCKIIDVTSLTKKRHPEAVFKSRTFITSSNNYTDTITLYHSELAEPKTFSPVLCEGNDSI